MSARDVMKLEGRLRDDLVRVGSTPPHGLGEVMVRRAVAHRQKSRFGVEVPQLLKAVGVASAGIAAGLLVAGLIGTPQFAGRQESSYAPPLQVACEDGSSQMVPPATAFEGPTDEEWAQQRSEGCLGIGIGLPVADLTLDGWNYRCPDGSCWSAGTETMLLILANLGPAYTGPTDVTLPGAGVPLQVEYQPRPYLRWRSADGTEGRSAVVTIDLTLLAQGEGDAIVILSDGSAYEVPDGLAQEILLTYFQPAS